MKSDIVYVDKHVSCGWSIENLLLLTKTKRRKHLELNLKVCDKSA